MSEPKHAFRYMGGGAGQAAAQQVAATPVAAAAPPVTAAAAEVVQTSQDARRQSLKKRGFSSTIQAGDTGGWFPGNDTPSPSNPKSSAGGGASAGVKSLGS